jgi:multimeric flavodoxin WrbA
MSSAFVSKKPTIVDVKKGSPSSRLERAEFEARFLSQFADPLFTDVSQELRAIAATAWDAYHGGRKAPRTHKAGQEFSDPDYDLAVEWLDTRDAIRAAQQRYQTQTSARILLVNGSPRNEHTCPSEVSKSLRLIDLAREELNTSGVEVDILDLSRVTSEYGRNIHPCKACFSTAPPLCHWPCSCYPNYSLGQTQDWMNEIYPMWVVAHGVMIVTPVHWFQVTSPLKLMMDRLVCADGGNPDPTRTQGKDAVLAKQIELDGWRYEQQLKGRLFSVVVHGDVEGAESVRRSIADWLRALGLQSAGAAGELDRMIGYLKPYATSHAELDMDTAVQDEVRNAAHTLLRAVRAQRAGLMADAGADLDAPRKK